MDPKAVQPKPSEDQPIETPTSLTEKIPPKLIFGLGALAIVILVPLSIWAYWADKSDQTQTTQTPETTRSAESSPSAQTEESAPEVEKEEGLVVHWSFDEGPGEILGDSSDTGATGTISGATWGEGKKGGALEFDGLDDRVEINEAGRIKVGALEYGTISLWFKYKNISSTEILPILYLGESNNSGTTDNLIIEIGHYDHGRTDDRRIYYTLYNNQYEPILCFDSNQNMEENTWYHFAVVNTPEGNTGYLNGVELTDRHYNFSDAQNTSFFSTITYKEAFYLGYGWFGIDKEFHYFEGSIDEVKIYDRALTADEIKALAEI